jgi:diguanylate cyclase (GGDEF)-like protein
MTDRQGGNGSQARELADNDTHGHKTRDEVLKALADLLRCSTREGEVACRYGGEEFAVVLPGSELTTAGQRAQTWLSQFRNRILDADGLPLRAAFSRGVAAFPRHGHTGEALPRAADQALYRAKEYGRNRVELAG